MEPIIAKNKLSREQYTKMNFYVSRRRLLWVSVTLAALFTGVYFFVGAQYRNDSTSTWIIGFTIFYLLLFPLLVYVKSRRIYGKVKWMGENKTYTMNDIEIRIDGETANMSIQWPNIDEVVERKSDFLILAFHKKSAIVLPFTSFDEPGDTERLKELIRSKSIKNNF